MTSFSDSTHNISWKSLINVHMSKKQHSVVLSYAASIYFSLYVYLLYSMMFIMISLELPQLMD